MTHCTIYSFATALSALSPPSSDVVLCFHTVLPRHILHRIFEGAVYVLVNDVTNVLEEHNRNEALVVLEDKQAER